MDRPIQLSIIIPVCNEADTIGKNLQCLRDTISLLAGVPPLLEIIVVDGGSTDSTVALARPYVDTIIQAKKGRASQMNAGAAQATGTFLLFLHADTRLPSKAFSFLSSNHQWGFYRVLLSGKAWPFRIIEAMINWRSCITQIATGDQCLFIRRHCFVSMQGFANIPLMEDIEISKRLRKQCAAYIIDEPVITSSRKWEQKGIVNTVLLMWYLRGLYFLGVSPHYLVKKYYSS